MKQTIILSLVMVAVSMTASTQQPEKVLLVPQTYTTIAAAVAAAQPNDIVRVSDGVYKVTAITMPTFVVHIESAGGRTATTLDGGGSTQRMFRYINANAGGRLKGFTFTNCREGVLEIQWNATPTIEDCEFLANQTAYDAGAVYMNRNAAPTIRRCVFTSNTASWRGGAIAGFGGCSPVLSDNTYSKNFASGHGGGAIYFSQCTPTITREIICQNSANDGGGLRLDGCTAAVSGCLVTRNRAINSAGGIMIHHANPATTVTSCAFLDNQASNNAGGVNMFHSPIQFHGNLVDGNQCHLGYAGGVEIWDSGGMTFEDNIVTNNRTQTNGGGVFCHSPADFKRNRIDSNTAVTGAGGGMFIEHAGNWISRNDFVTRNQSQTNGGGIFVRWTTRADLIHDTVAYNQTPAATGTGGGIYADSTTLNLYNAILYGNTANIATSVDLIGTTLLIDNSLIQNGLPSVRVGANSKVNTMGPLHTFNPLFVNPSIGDTHLTWSSPCRRKGNPLVPNLPQADHDGDPRQGYDLGADEVAPSFYIAGTLRWGTTATLTCVGKPGVSCTVLVSTHPTLLSPPIPVPGGLLHLQPPFHPLPIGLTNQSGIATLSMPLPAPPLPRTFVTLQALVGIQPTLGVSARIW